MCISETHVTEDFQDSELEVAGYSTVGQHSTSRHTGGVIIYVKDEYRFKILIRETINMNVWIVGVRVSINKQNFNIINLYHSPGASDADFLVKFEDILEVYAVKPGKLIILGDFNIDQLKNTF